MEKVPLWYKDAVIYEVHVRAFCDSDMDGIGDFRGLTSRLDYLADLGATAIWLLPFYPSPLKDDGYDIADYSNVHPSYGTLEDFKAFLDEAHKRGLRVITELVLNHTSDQHWWFRRARKAPQGSNERDYYVWSPTARKFKDARIIFSDFETSNWAWDETSQTYYWHRFYSHQPDLNFDNSEVRRAMFEVVDFWFGMGVDGLRLDAVPYLVEREGTHCENLPETHAFLKDLRAHVDSQYQDRMLLAEANQWPEDAAGYFGKGDECHMAFHFPIMPRLFMAIHMEDRFPLVDILQQTPRIPESCQWALFLRNHDELTLEMVTDEERDYMYRVYANDPKARINLGIRRRLGPLLGNNRRKIELMNGILFSLPGTPVIYYGDELGMGDNIYLGDRNGVRTPMQWSGDRNAGFSRANPQQLYLPVIIDPEYHYETVNVEAQQKNVHSLLWWMKRMIALNRKFKAFGRGSIEFLAPENRKILVFVRQFGEERILLVANLSRFVQYAELDLSAFRGMVPVELFGQNEFPVIGQNPYTVMLGPHSFYWFSLEPARVPELAAAAAAQRSFPVVEVAGTWQNTFSGRARAQVEALLPAFIRERRWFAGKARKIRRAQIVELIPLGRDFTAGLIAFFQLDYREGVSERYSLPLAFAALEKTGVLEQNVPESILCKVRVKDGNASDEGAIFDAMYDKEFLQGILESIRAEAQFSGLQGVLQARRTHAFAQITDVTAALPEPSPVKAEQSNTSILYGDRFILKLIRKIEEGLNPELELCRHLSEEKGFTHIPAIAGFMVYTRGRSEPATLGILQSFVPNQGDAWKYTLDMLGDYFERVLARLKAGRAQPDLVAGPFSLIRQSADALAVELINPYLEMARLLGQRTAQLHLALSEETTEADFSPEPFTPFYQRSLYQSFRNLMAESFNLLDRQMKMLPEEAKTEARALSGRQDEILKRFHKILETNFSAMRTRYHGDFHLGQVLYTGKDFVLIDFEGEPARSLQERKIKKCPLIDVAGMLRSFHYAAYTSLLSSHAEGFMRPEDIPILEPWTWFWYQWVASSYLRSYLETSKTGAFLPKDESEIEALLDVFTLEKAVYELAYELNSRPAWVKVPIRGILHLLNDKEKSEIRDPKSERNSKV